ncbi:MAG: transposase [Planctomycetota bacterium]
MSGSKRAKRKQTSGLKPRIKNSRRSSHKDGLAALMDWFLPSDQIFAKMKFHGNTSWSPRRLVLLALCWALSGTRNLTDRFSEAAESCKTISGALPVGTYQGFMKALVRWTSSFMKLMWPLLHERMEEIGGRFWRIGKWVPIAFDGSRSTAPRTKANQRALCAPNYGKGLRARYGKKKSKGLRRQRNKQRKTQPQEPQAWITLMWHMGLRLPWMWRLGPSNSSERAHVVEMLNAGEFPKKTLFCGDAGFVGYPLWSAILQGGHHFLIRVGANVQLLKESADFSLQKNSIVLCWPNAVRRGNQPPLRLRLIKVRIGKAKVWMLTSVLESTHLTIKQATKLYEFRWGIEVEFRGLKQTLECGKLRSRNDRRLLAELDWSIMAMTVAELFALKEQLAKKRSPTTKTSPPPDPAKRSLANTIRVLRYCLRNLSKVPRRNQDLQTRLQNAVIDSYRRRKPKRARYRPSNPDKKPLGNPKLRKMTSEERKKLNEIAI